MTTGVPIGSSILARALRARMADLGLSQKRLAIEAGLHETYVRDILKGKSANPGYAGLQKLAARLGCKVEDLVGGGQEGGGSPLIGSQAKGDSETVYEPDAVAFVRLWKFLDRETRDSIITLATRAATNARQRKVG